ncbi:MAG: hypothetical protein KatS3mg031_2080 [Chitinophagales bacterium]|nr:MAG: hypothetical protein KatS3mg031_2080 [Chitinophagales bacterium]
MAKNVFILLLSFITGYAYAQKTVSGVVTASDTKEALPSVNVLVQGTSAGTVTDLDGRFSITMPEGSTTLVFKYVGYQDLEVSIGKDETTINIVMQPQDIGLNPVIVSASRSEERILDAPASVTVLNSEKIENKPAITVADHMEDVPGVDVMKTGVHSSNVVVRGFNNIFSTSVLNIIDNRIASVPSLRVNAYQLVPTSNYDIERVEVVRGPGSALYGPNAADGVIAIFTKSPLDGRKFEITHASTIGTRVMGGDINPATGKSYDEGKSLIQRGIWGDELRISGKAGEKFGYKISGRYYGGYDWRYYDPREPKVGDTLIFGSAKFGEVFQEDTTIARKPFDRDFSTEKYDADLRFDYRFNKDIELILSGGLSHASGIELTGLGAAQVRNWTYYNGQLRFRWKKLHFQYFINASNAGETYLIPQVSGDPPPHEVQLLVDKSKLHVVTLQHSIRPVESLNLIYGMDALLTVPETEGTINGRFENEDNVYQVGGYLQGEWDIIKKLSLVAAARVDWHNKIDGVFISPRAALVYKPTSRHTLRATYNRAFSPPTTLNFSLDLANVFIPNGIRARGIGNPDGYQYHFEPGDPNPWFISPEDMQWRPVNDKSYNAIYFDSVVAIIAGGLKEQAPASVKPLVDGLVKGLLRGIGGDTGTIANVSHTLVDLVKLSETGDFKQSKVDLASFKDFPGIDNQVTQTWELGYKGILFDRLFITADFYYTRISNYISPLTNSTGSVMFDPEELDAALGPDAPGGLLYDNVAVADALIAPLLDGNPDYGSGVPNGTAYDEVRNIIKGAFGLIPMGSVTPENEKVGPDIILVYRNLGTIDVGGMDLALNFFVTENFNVGFSYSYVTRDSIPLEGAQGGYVALNAPKNKLAASAEYKHKSGLSGRLTYRWQAGFPANSAVYVGRVNPVHTLSMGLGYKFPDKIGVSLSLDIQNIFLGPRDARSPNYSLSHGPRFSPFPGAPEMGPLALLRVAYTFKTAK